MDSVNQRKVTALTILVAVLVGTWGIGLVVDPDSSVGDRSLGVVFVVAAATSGLGLWCLAGNRLTVGINQTLIVAAPIAAVVLAALALAEDFAFFVWVFGPVLVLALLALWFGVIGRGLQTELAQPGAS